MKGSKQNKQPGSGRARFIAAAIALLSAVAVFGIMLKFERDMLESYEKETVYVISKPIGKGQLLCADNYMNYLEKREVEASIVTTNTVKEPANLKESYCVADLREGTVLTFDLLEEKDKVLRELENPVIAGFKADDLYQVVGGVLRRGDRIHIYTIGENEEAMGETYKNIFVQGVFDQSGTMIENDDKSSTVARVNIYLSADEVWNFYQGLSKGSLRAVKVCQ